MKCILCWWISRINCTVYLLLGFWAVAWQRQAPPDFYLPYSPITAVSLPFCGHISPAMVPPQALRCSCFLCLYLFVTFSARASLPTPFKKTARGPALPHCPAFSPAISHTAGFTCLPAPLPSCDLHEGRDCCLCVHCGISSTQHRI